MMNTKLPRVLTLLILVALLTMSCKCGALSSILGGDEDKEKESQTEDSMEENAPSSDVEEEAPAAPGVELDDVMEIGEGGFSFRPVPGYQVENFMGFASMVAPDADEDLGPAFIFIGGVNEDAMTLDEMYDKFVADLDEAEASSLQKNKVMVDGINGYMVDLESEEGGQPFQGRVVMVMVTSNQEFTMVASAPPERWDEIDGYFDAVLDSVSFFEPTEMSVEDLGLPDMPEMETGGMEFRQWAMSATASSEYDNPDWSAMQAAGEPDTESCGDYETAWASADKYGVDWIELDYLLPVEPTQINIYITHTPNQVVKVELRDIGGAYYEVYRGVPEMTDCPLTLTIDVEGADYQADGVKITVDQTQLDLPWNEIDAVELVGYDAMGMQDSSEAPGSVTDQSSTGLGDVASWIWSFYTEEDGLAGGMVQDMFFAPDRTLWIATNGADTDVGLSHMYAGEFENFGTDDGLGAKDVRSILVDPDDTAWAGTAWGLARQDDDGWQNFLKEDGLVGNNINALALGPDDIKWAGTADGFTILGGASWTNYTSADGLAGDKINDIAFDGEETAWFATVYGVTTFDGSEWVTYTVDDGLALDTVTCLAAAPDGSIWAGTPGGGASHFADGVWTSYLTDSGNYVRDIAVTGDGIVWFATEGDGIFRFDGESWINITTADGIPNDWVDAIVAANDNSIWAAFRDNGIGHFWP